MAQRQTSSTGPLSRPCSRFRVCGTRMTGSTFKDGLQGESSEFNSTRKVVFGTGKSGRCNNGFARSTVACARNLGSAEILVGDVVLLFAFCLYKQIMAIVMSPTFAGWLAPIGFNPVRFEELLGFVVTVVGTWVACSTILGDYKTRSESASESFRHAFAGFEQVHVWTTTALCVPRSVPNHMLLCRYAASTDQSLQNMAGQYACDGCTARSCDCSREW